MLNLSFDLRPWARSTKVSMLHKQGMPDGKTDKGYEAQRSARDEYNQVKLSRTISIVLVVNREYGSHLSFRDEG